MSNLSLEPLISPVQWAAIALAAIIVIAVYAARRPMALSRFRWGLIVLLMGLSIAFVLGVMLNPTWVTVLPPPAGKPRLTLLVDASCSMATPDAGSERTRFDFACEVAKGLAEKNADEYDIRLCTFTDRTAPVEPGDLAGIPPKGLQTDLSAVLREALAEEQPQGQAVVLVSDGIQNAAAGVRDVLDAAHLAKAMTAPIYSLAVGSDLTVTDIALQLRSQTELAFIDEEAAIAATIEHQGWEGSTDVILSLEGHESERQSVRLVGDAPATLRFPVKQQKPGLYRYDVRVEPAPGEISAANNAASFVLRVVDQPIRALMLEGKPYWDAKFLIRTLTSDAIFDLDSIVHMTEDRFLRQSHPRQKAVATAASGTAAAPITRTTQWKVLKSGAGVLADAEQLRNYQVLLLGRESDSFLDENTQSVLRKWIVEDGGSLICYRGSPTARLTERMARMLPVRVTPQREARFRMKPTDSGRASSWLPGSDADEDGDVLSVLPMLTADARSDSPKPAAVIVATALTADGSSNPVVTYQSYGAGRVVYVEGSGMWRWAFLPPDQQAHDSIYHGMWHRLLAWLVSSTSLPPGELMALRGDKVTFSEGEPATASLFIRAEAAARGVPNIELTGPGLPEPKQYTPAPSSGESGTFRVVFGELPEGRYLAKIVDAPSGSTAAEIAFDVRGFVHEQLDLRARPALMARIAEESGGAIVDPGNLDAIRSHFRNYLAASRPTQIRRTPAWDRWWALVGSFTLWMSSWGLRRMSGLI